MTNPIVDEQLLSVADLGAQRRALIASRWSSIRELASVSRDKGLRECFSRHEITAVVAACAEATAWTLVVAEALKLEICQPWVGSHSGARVAVLEPVLVTGAGIGRAAACLRAAGAGVVVGVVGESLSDVVTAEDLGVDALQRLALR